jgi:WhiB family redox-sensing transcriptional regulator
MSRNGVPAGIDGSSWRDRAACRAADPTLFFAADGETNYGRVVREARAKNVCARCSVRAACLRFCALTRPAYGIWAGLSEADRANGWRP